MGSGRIVEGYDAPMANYTVKLGAKPKGHDVPPLLNDFGDFVGTQKHGTLGWFDRIAVTEIPKAWNPTAAGRLRAHGFAFLDLPDGSLLALLTYDPKAPAAVVLIGSEGDARTVANSFEELLALWAKGETGISDLDDDEADRKAFLLWLKGKKVKAPKVKSDFDFEAWLDDSPAPPKKPAASAAKSIRDPAAMKDLGPKLRQLAEVVGQSTAAPAVVDYITKTLGKKVPQKSGDNVSALKVGIELAANHDVRRLDFPLVPKTAKTFVPYVTYAWVTEQFGELVLGIPWNADQAAIEKQLGKPTALKRQFTTEAKPTIPLWERALGGGVKLEIQFSKNMRVTLSVEQARSLAASPTVFTALFVAWAATRGLLDESQFADQANLLAGVKTRKAKGSELMKAALPRGLWDAHLKNDPDLRLAAFQWFHNLKNAYIEDDLKKVFGKAKLEDDSWEAVDKADKVFKSRFGKWL